MKDKIYITGDFSGGYEFTVRRAKGKRRTKKYLPVLNQLHRYYTFLNFYQGITMKDLIRWDKVKNLLRSKGVKL